MTRRALTLIGVAAVAALAAWNARAEEKAHKLTTVSLRKMADSLHAVIAADQRIYVEVAAAADAAHPRPNHAEALRKAAQSIQTRGAEFSYTLRSLAPINGNNGPQTEVEQTGLTLVAQRPGEAYYAEEELGGRSYFTAVYASRATSASCLDCHNRHERSPRRDYRAGDVLGGVVVRIPLEF